jgi:hypothetical protein
MTNILCQYNGASGFRHILSMPFFKVLKQAAVPGSESMWDCMWVASKVCVPFFLATVVIGNLVVSDLFLSYHKSYDLVHLTMVPIRLSILC